MTTLTPNIWQLQSRRDIPGLIEALSHEDPDVRRRAAAALRTLDAAEAVPALNEALAAEKDWLVQASITAAIQHLTRSSHLQELIAQKNIPGLINLLYSTNSEDIIGAAEALGDLGDRLAVEALVIVFRNPLMPDAVRFAAAEALIKLKSAPAIVTLLAALRRENWQVRRNAAMVLGQLRASWATPALIDVLRDDNLVVRREALVALRQIGTPAALKAVEEFERTTTDELETLEMPPLP